MKRSEMVDGIWAFVQHVENDYDVYFTREDCDRLLSLIEKVGMCPPVTELAVIEGEPILGHKWDKED